MWGVAPFFNYTMQRVYALVVVQAMAAAINRALGQRCFSPLATIWLQARSFSARTASD